MKDIFTPEQANMTVTYGELMKILTPLIEMITQGSSDLAVKNAEIMSDYIIKIRDNASYERQRDIRFVLNYLARLWGCSKDIMYDNYQSWCDEFDKLNKPQKDEDKKDE